MQGRDGDIAILGGGLAGGLIALALARLRPELRTVLIEQAPRLGGNHVWSFFATDLSAAGTALVEPMVAARWDGYEVRFPGHARHLPTAYRAITSDRLDAYVRATLPADTIRLNSPVIDAGARHVVLADGQRLEFGGVIDARGATALPHLTGGWQKFAGQMIRTARPHGLVRPIVMDARVEQIDGYRFVYCLPFSADTVFVEDTYYSDGPELDLPALDARIARYVAAEGWEVAEILSRESGVLPVVGGGDWGAFRTAQEHGSALAGVRAGLFHPLTSYSLPTAMAFALDVAATDDLSGTGLAAQTRAWAERHWRNGGFYRMLSAMLFAAAAPDKRFKVLERFYRLDEKLIERFYAGGTTMVDKARILIGKPPVPLGAALRAITGQTPLALLEAGR